MLSNPANDITQDVNMPDQQMVAMPLQQINGKEIGATRMPQTAIIRHSSDIQVYGAMPAGYCTLPDREKLLDTHRSYLMNISYPLQHFINPILFQGAHAISERGHEHVSDACMLLNVLFQGISRS